MDDSRDTVSLYALELAANVGQDQWERVRAQRVLLTVHAETPLADAGRSDDVAHTLHYGHLAAALSALEQDAFPSLCHLALAAAAVAWGPEFVAAGVQRVHVVAEAPKLLLQADALAAEVKRSGEEMGPRVAVHINGLRVQTTIGVNPPERVHKQQVVLSVTFWDPSPPLFPHRLIARRLSEHVESSAFLTLEALATSLARVACFLDGIDRVTIKAQKPSAVAFAHASGVQMTRDRAFFAQCDHEGHEHEEM